MQLGEIYSDKKEYSEAIKYLEDSLKIKPDYLKSTGIYLCTKR